MTSLIRRLTDDVCNWGMGTARERQRTESVFPRLQVLPEQLEQQAQDSPSTSQFAATLDRLVGRAG